MLRGFYLSSILLSIVLAIVSLYYISEVSSARMDALFNSMNNYSQDPYDSYSSYNYYDDDRDNDITVEAGLVTVFFFLFFAALQILTIIKLKTKTMKVISIIGVSLTGIMLAWDGVMMSSPGGISFDEVGVVWVLYAVILLAFSIIGTVHAFKKKA